MSGTPTTRAVRATMYPPPGYPGRLVMTVVRDVDVTVSLEEYVAKVAQPGLFTLFDVFDVRDDCSIERATEMACERQRQRAERETAMALFYHWNAGRLPMLRPGGVTTATRPAPLSVEELTEAMKQLARHPDYRSHTVIAIAEDGTVLSMRNGEVAVLGGPRP